MDKEIQELTKLIREYNERNRMWTSSVSASLIRLKGNHVVTDAVIDESFLTVDEVHFHSGWLEIKPPSPNLLPNILQEYVTPHRGWALKDMLVVDGKTTVVHVFDGYEITVTSLI